MGGLGVSSLKNEIDCQALNIGRESEVSFP